MKTERKVLILGQNGNISRGLGRNFAFSLRFGLGLLFCILMLQACKTRATKTAGYGPALFRCLYLMEQKYAEDQNPGEVADWIAEIKAEFKSEDFSLDHYDLFSHNGGGPLGAEWNSDGDLLLAAWLPLRPVDLKEISFRFGEIRERPMTEALDGGTWCWLRIPFESWSSQLVPIEAQHYDLLYDKEKQRLYPAAPDGPVGQGQILVTSLSFETIEGLSESLCKAFHLDGGE